MASTFAVVPDFGVAVNVKPVVKSARFGDGYEQRVAYGINNKPQIWDVKFQNRTDAETSAVETFLTTQGGVAWFWWIPPNQTVSLKFICREWNKIVERNNLNTLTAKFEQVFDNL